MESYREQIQAMMDRIHQVDPYMVILPEKDQGDLHSHPSAGGDVSGGSRRPKAADLYVPSTAATYADIAAGRSSPCPFVEQSNERNEKMKHLPKKSVVTRTVIESKDVAKEEKAPEACENLRFEQEDKKDEEAKPVEEIIALKSVEKVQDAVPSNVKPNVSVKIEEMTSTESQFVNSTTRGEKSRPSRRGRSQQRRDAQERKTNPKTQTESAPTHELEVSSCEEPLRTTLSENKKHQIVLKQPQDTLKPQVRRGRSPSPMWNPGSTSYADILRGRQSSEGHEETAPVAVTEVEVAPVLEKHEEKFQYPQEEWSMPTSSETYPQSDVFTDKTSVENVETYDVDETSRMREVVEKMAPTEVVESGTFLQEEVLASVHEHELGGIPVPPGMFEYIQQPAPDLVGFIASGQQLLNSGLGTYHTSPHPYVMSHDGDQTMVYPVTQPPVPQYEAIPVDSGHYMQPPIQAVAYTAPVHDDFVAQPYDLPQQEVLEDQSMVTSPEVTPVHSTKRLKKVKPNYSTQSEMTPAVSSEDIPAPCLECEQLTEDTVMQTDVDKCPLSYAQILAQGLCIKQLQPSSQEVIITAGRNDRPQSPQQTSSVSSYTRTWSTSPSRVIPSTVREEVDKPNVVADVTNGTKPENKPGKKKKETKHKKETDNNITQSISEENVTKTGKGRKKKTVLNTAVELSDKQELASDSRQLPEAETKTVENIGEPDTDILDSTSVPDNSLASVKGKKVGSKKQKTSEDNKQMNIDNKPVSQISLQSNGTVEITNNKTETEQQKQLQPSDNEKQDDVNDLEKKRKQKKKKSEKFTSEDEIEKALKEIAKMEKSQTKHKIKSVDPVQDTKHDTTKSEKDDKKLKKPRSEEVESKQTPTMVPSVTVSTVEAQDNLQDDKPDANVSSAEMSKRQLKRRKKHKKTVESETDQIPNVKSDNSKDTQADQNIKSDTNVNLKTGNVAPPDLLADINVEISKHSVDIAVSSDEHVGKEKSQISEPSTPVLSTSKKSSKKAKNASNSSKENNVNDGNQLIATSKSPCSPKDNLDLDLKKDEELKKNEIEEAREFISNKEASVKKEEINDKDKEVNKNKKVNKKSKKGKESDAKEKKESENKSIISAEKMLEGSSNKKDVSDAEMKTSDPLPETENVPVPMELTETPMPSEVQAIKGKPKKGKKSKSTQKTDGVNVKSAVTKPSETNSLLETRSIDFIPTEPVHTTSEVTASNIVSTEERNKKKKSKKSKKQKTAGENKQEQEIKSSEQENNENLQVASVSASLQIDANKMPDAEVKAEDQVEVKTTGHQNEQSAKAKKNKKSKKSKIGVTEVSTGEIKESTVPPAEMEIKEMIGFSISETDEVSEKMKEVHVVTVPDKAGEKVEDNSGIPEPDKTNEKFDKVLDSNTSVLTKASDQVEETSHPGILLSQTAVENIEEVMKSTIPAQDQENEKTELDSVILLDDIVSDIVTEKDDITHKSPTVKEEPSEVNKLELTPEHEEVLRNIEKHDHQEVVVESVKTDTVTPSESILTFEKVSSIPTDEADKKVEETVPVGTCKLKRRDTKKKIRRATNILPSDIKVNIMSKMESDSELSNATPTSPQSPIGDAKAAPQSPILDSKTTQSPVVVDSETTPQSPIVDSKTPQSPVVDSKLTPSVASATKLNTGEDLESVMLTPQWMSKSPIPLKMKPSSSYTILDPSLPDPSQIIEIIKPKEDKPVISAPPAEDKAPEVQSSNSGVTEENITPQQECINVDYSLDENAGIFGSVKERTRKPRKIIDTMTLDEKAIKLGETSTLFSSPEKKKKHTKTPLQKGDSKKSEEKDFDDSKENEEEYQLLKEKMKKKKKRPKLPEEFIQSAVRDKEIPKANETVTVTHESDVKEEKVESVETNIVNVSEEIQDSKQTAASKKDNFSDAWLTALDEPMVFDDEDDNDIKPPVPCSEEVLQPTPQIKDVNINKQQPSQLGKVSSKRKEKRGKVIKDAAKSETPESRNTQIETTQENAPDTVIEDKKKSDSKDKPKAEESSKMPETIEENAKVKHSQVVHVEESSEIPEVVPEGTDVSVSDETGKKESDSACVIKSDELSDAWMNALDEPMMFDDDEGDDNPSAPESEKINTKEENDVKIADLSSPFCEINAGTGHTIKQELCETKFETTQLKINETPLAENNVTVEEKKIDSKTSSLPQHMDEFSDAWLNALDEPMVFDDDDDEDIEKVADKVDAPVKIENSGKHNLDVTCVSKTEPTDLLVEEEEEEEEIKTDIFSDPSAARSIVEELKPNYYLYRDAEIHWQEKIAQEVKKSPYPHSKHAEKLEETEVTVLEESKFEGNKETDQLETKPEPSEKGWEDGKHKMSAGEKFQLNFALEPQPYDMNILRDAERKWQEMKACEQQVLHEENESIEFTEEHCLEMQQKNSHDLTQNVAKPVLTEHLGKVSSKQKEKRGKLICDTDEDVAKSERPESQNAQIETTQEKSPDTVMEDKKKLDSKYKPLQQPIDEFSDAWLDALDEPMVFDDDDEEEEEETKAKTTDEKQDVVKCKQDVVQCLSQEQKQEEEVDVLESQDKGKLDLLCNLGKENVWLESAKFLDAEVKWQEMNSKIVPKESELPRDTERVEKPEKPQDLNTSSLPVAKPPTHLAKEKPVSKSDDQEVKLLSDPTFTENKNKILLEDPAAEKSYIHYDTASIHIAENILQEKIAVSKCEIALEDKSAENTDTVLKDHSAEISYQSYDIPGMYDAQKNSQEKVVETKPVTVPETVGETNKLAKKDVKENQEETIPEPFSEKLFNQYDIPEIHMAEKNFHETKARSKSPENRFEGVPLIKAETVTSTESRSDQPMKTWANVVGTKMSDIPLHEKPAESNISKAVIVPEKKEMKEMPHPVQICVQEVEKQEVKESLVEVDPEGFIEFIPKREMRKRKSRSRSRSRCKNESESSEKESKAESDPIKTETIVTSFIDPSSSLMPASSIKDLGTDTEVTKSKLVKEAQKTKASKTEEKKKGKGDKKVVKPSVPTFPDRKESEPISEIEKEIEVIVHSFQRECILPYHLTLEGAFWPDKWRYDDAEVQYQELIAQSLKKPQAKTPDSEIKPDETHDRRDDSDGGNSGHSSPGPHTPKGGGGNGGLGSSGFTEQLSTDLPGGICSWPDESTYLSGPDLLVMCTDEEDHASRLAHRVAEDVITDLDDEDPFCPPSSADQEVLQPSYRKDDNTAIFLAQMKASLSSDVEALQQAVETSETDLSSLPADSLNSMFNALVKVLEDLQLKEQEAVKLEGVIRELPQDAETQSLDATLAGVRTRLVTLMSQAEQGKTTVEVAKGIQEKRQQEVLQYQTLLTDVEQWLNTVKATLAADIQKVSPEDTRSQLVAHDNLSRELSLKEEKLSELTEHCKHLQDYPDVSQLALTLLSHLTLLQTIIHESAQEVKTRQDLLQELLKEQQPEMQQQKHMASPLEVETPVQPSLPEHEPKILPDDVDDGFILVSHPQSSLPIEEKVAVQDGKVPDAESPAISQHEAAADDTIASDASPIPDEEVPVHSPLPADFEVIQEPVALEVGSQTGNSLLFELPKKKTVFISDVETRDIGITCLAPVDMQVQTEFSSKSSSEVVPVKVPTEAAIQTVKDTSTSPAAESQKNKIHVLQRVTGDEETIEIATKAGIASAAKDATMQPERSDTNDDLYVEVKFKGKGKEDGSQPATTSSELNIIHTAPQSFETLMVDPGASTTEVFVDKDGNKKVIIRKVQRTLISQQQQHTMQQSYQTFTSSGFGIEGADVPASQSVAFSKVTLQGQESTSALSHGDGKVEVTTSKTYSGHVAEGIPGGNITISEFSSEPQHETITYHTSGEVDNLAAPPLADLKSPDGSETYTVTEPADDIIPEHLTPEGQFITTTSSVQAVVQQVTRRVVRKIRRVIRKVVIVDGKEQVTEEVIEEPEEVEVTEEEDVPRVRVEISRTHGENGIHLTEQMYKPSFQMDPGFAPGVSQSLTFEQGAISSPNVPVDKSGKPLIGTQDVFLVETHKPSQLQKQLMEDVINGKVTMEYVQKKLAEGSDDSVYIQEERIEDKGQDFESQIEAKAETPGSETHLASIEEIPISETTSDVKPEEKIEIKPIEATEPAKISLESSEGSVSEVFLPEEVGLKGKGAKSKKKSKPKKSLGAEIKSEVSKSETEEEVVKIKNIPCQEQETIAEIMPQTSPREATETVEISLSIEEKSKLIDTVPDVPTNVSTPMESKGMPKEDSSSKSEPESSGSKKDKKKKKSKGKEVKESPQIEIQPGTPEERHDDELSVETSLAESTEIIVPCSTSSSDTTKPTEQEIVLPETPLSPVSPRESEKTHDTGYDPEEKTTFDEMSLTEEDHKKNKNKKKKKRKQKVKTKDQDESSSARPKSSADPFSSDISATEKHDIESTRESGLEEPVQKPDDTTAVSSASPLEEKVPSEDVGSERKGKKRKWDKKDTETPVGESVNVASSLTPEFQEEQYREIKSDEDGTVKIIEEAVPTRPPSEAIESLVEVPPKSVEVWELMQVQEQSIQTLTPEPTKPDVVTTETSMQTNHEQLPLMEDNVTQTTTPDVPVIEKPETIDLSVQTLKEELTPTLEESSQTKTPEQEKLITAETSIQTSQTPPPSHEESVQTITPEPLPTITIDTTDSSVQTKVREMQEGSMQTVTPEIPVTDTIETSSQTSKDELPESPVKEPSPKLETTEMSIQTLKEEIIPVSEEYAQTITPETPAEIAIETSEMSSQTSKEEPVPTLEGSMQTDSPEVQDRVTVDTYETSIQTVKEEILPTAEEFSQTSPEMPVDDKSEVSENATQTAILQTTNMTSQTLEETTPKEEQFTQTVPSDESQDKKIETADSSIQTKKEELTPTSEESSQTTELKQTPPVALEPDRTVIVERPVIPTDQEKSTTEGESGENLATTDSTTPITPKTDTAESSIQTKPVLVREYGEEISHSSSSDEPYEIHVQTSVSFTPSFNPSEPYRTSYETFVGSSGDGQPRDANRTYEFSESTFEQSFTVGDSPGGLVEEVPMPSVQESPKQVTRKVLYMPGEEIKPIITEIKRPVLGLAITTEEHIEPTISITELPSVETIKEASQDLLAFEASVETRDRAEKGKSMPDLEIDKNITDQKEEAVKVKKSKHKKKGKKTQDSDKGSVHEPVPSNIESTATVKSPVSAETTESESVSTDVSGSGHPSKELTESEPESSTAETALQKQPGNLTQDKPTDTTSGKKKKSKKGPKGSKSPMESKTGDQLPTSEDISFVSKPLYSDISKHTSAPEEDSSMFLAEERKSSGHPVRGEHSPGPPLIPCKPTDTGGILDSGSDKDKKSTTVNDTVSTTKDTQDKPEEVNEQSVPDDSSDTLRLKETEDGVTPSVEQTSVVLPGQYADGISIPSEETTEQTWSTAKSILSKRMKNLKNARKTTHMSGLLCLATLQEVAPEEPIEQKNEHVQHNLNLLRSALEKKDVVVIQRTIITTVETISTWLETIEYRVYLNRQKTSTVPSQEQIKEYTGLKAEISHIEESVGALGGVLDTASDICDDEDRNRIKECIASLQEQMKAVEEITQESEEQVAKDLSRWEEFLNGVNNISVLVEELKQKLDELIQSDISAKVKLEELDEIETLNRCHMGKTARLLGTAKNLIKEFPEREIPPETNSAHETTKAIEHSVVLERERLLHLLSLVDDYEQTLKELSQIIDVADTLVESPISVISLEHLQEEMQKHRKFFVNLSHCRGILESLEGNLDPETRALHCELHQTLHCRATAVLDKAAGRAQQMALAASRWTVLEQGMKEERGWLQVAHQRVPDLQSVNSSDYDQYISMYQSLSSDVAVHHARIMQLLAIAHRLEELVTSNGLDARYDEHLEVILKLQDDVNSNLQRLLAFQDMWSSYDVMIEKLLLWMERAEKDLDAISAQTMPPGGNTRQFWELKAQYEVHSNIHNEAASTFETAIRIIPVADEMVQRQLNAQLEERWRGVADRINRIQSSIMQNISSQDVPFNEKLILLEQELQEVKGTIDDIHGVLKSEEELNLYIERLQVLRERVEHIQEELGRLGLLSATESEKVSALLSTARRLDNQVSEELEGSMLLREKLQAIQKGLSRVKRNHQRASSVLDQCEASEKLGSDVVEQAVINCQAVAEELKSHWQDLMALRQLLHTLPMSLRLSVSPVKVEREISQLQDEHTDLENRCDKLLILLRSRLGLWRRFERQLEMVQQNVQEADYMMELLTVQSSVDYDRLLKATERLEGLYGSLDEREDLLQELKSAAEPLAASCTPEVSQKIEAAVEQAVTAWNDTCQSLLDLCTRYQDAVRLWKQYREASEAVKAWADQQLDSVAHLNPEDALKQVKVCEETLATHKSRLGELKGLVAQIAKDVGLEAGGLLEAEVDALGKRLEDVRETLATLAEVAETRAANKELCSDDLMQTKSFLSSVQQSLTAVEESNEKDVENQLGALHNHLVALSRTEGQLQTLKDKTIDLVPVTTRPETSVVEILQLWQQVFRETFQQYHRLSARLVKSQDGAAALRLWQEYLHHVQSFLSGSIPEDYDSLTEHQHLCEVHQNLLSSQQSALLSKGDDAEGKFGRELVELSIAEQFNSLTNLHNETLSRIMERHEEVRERIASWDQYRQDQAKLLGWLRDTERERGKIQLRYIHTRRVPNMIRRIQYLLDKVPSGESQAEQLQEQQNKLLHFCDDALATSIRMEHAAITQRIGNLQAGLETWRDFLNRVVLLTATYEEQVKRIESVFSDVHNTISEPVPLPLSHTGMQNRLENLRHLRSVLQDMTKDLEELGVTQEQLKECVSPMDMKTINQKVWLLWQSQGDLDHHLAVLCHQLEEKLGLKTLFDTRQSRFLMWATDIESRVEQGSTAGDPEEILRRLETELKGEVSLKSREVEWLLSTGTELLQACGGDGQGDADLRTEIEDKVQQVHEAWDRLQNISKSRANKLHDILQTMSQLEIRIAELRAWLYQVEAQLIRPMVFETCSKEVVESKLKEHEDLQKTIEKQSSNIADVLNLCELLLSDCESCKTSLNTEAITAATESLEKRWKNVCGLSAEKKQRILTVWTLLQEVLKLYEEQNQWLEKQEQILRDLDSRTEQKSEDEIQDLILTVETTIKEIDSHGPALQILDQTYAKLLKDSGLELENLQHLTSTVRSMLLRWHQLTPTAFRILQRLHGELQVYRDFVSAHGKAVVCLTNVDVRLTEMQHLATQPTMPTVRLQQIELLESELEANRSLLQNADELGLIVMERSRPEELPAIQEMIDEYQLLYKDIKARISVLKSQCKEEVERTGRKVVEVDESVQVETLKFEQDTEVQVDTLPPLPPLMRLTSRDAYLYELETAIRECSLNLDSLEDALKSPTPQQTNRAHGPTSQLSKLTATCQSSVELIKHLSTLLVEECGATEEYARTREVQELSIRYEDLVSRARAREQQLRELSESARLTCPLCSRKNWQQLDNDLWRLEQWLQYAEGTQSSQTSPPSHIEKLEDTIQDHREFLMDLDSHKSIVVSLNIVGTHLADHTEDTERAEQLRSRLVTTNSRWDAVCRSAAAWQTQLQTALMENHQFHQTIQELVDWLIKTENTIRQTEPVDLTDDLQVIEAKYNKFRELRSDLERCEPRVMSLQEAADQLLRQSEAPEGATTTWSRLTDLRLKLQSLRRLTGVYILKLGAVLGRDPSELGMSITTAATSGRSTAATSLMSLSQELLDQAAPGQIEGSPNQQHQIDNGTGEPDDVDTTVLARGYRFLGRVVRASLPIQALMLLLLGVASLVPTGEEDYSCSLTNNFARSLEPMLRYPNGPPPI